MEGIVATISNIRNGDSETLNNGNAVTSLAPDNDLTRKRKAEHIETSSDLIALPIGAAKKMVQKGEMTPEQVMFHMIANMLSRNRPHTHDPVVISGPTSIKDQRKSLEEAKKTFGQLATAYKEENGDNNTYAIPGMKSRLRDYQLVTAGFVLRIERAIKGPNCGGIVADDMGVGKTVSTLAAILSHPPSKQKVTEGRATTLVVVPNQGLKRQWRKEIEKHTEAARLLDSCQDYNKNLAEGAIKGCLIVLATYGEVVRDNKVNGPLSRIQFYRVILDEGDAIKNPLSATSVACCKLTATHKWVLTGTPFQNSVQEIRPYIRFLGIDIGAEDFLQRYNISEDFKDKPDARMLKVLNYHMTGRMKGELFMNQPVGGLNCKLTIETRYVDPSMEDRIIYNFTESVLRNRLLEAITEWCYHKGRMSEVMNEYYNLVMRLRMAVDHPLTLEPCIKKCSPTEIRKLMETLDAIKDQRPLFEQLNIRCQDELAQAQSPLDSTAISIPEGLSQSPRSILDLRQCLSDTITSLCSICQVISKEVGKVKCEHTLCFNCYDKILRAALERKEATAKCPKCDVSFPAQLEDDSTMSTAIGSNSQRDSIQKQLEDATEVIIKGPGGHRVRHKMGSSPAEDFNGMEPIGSATNQWESICDKPGQTAVPSTKITTAVNIVMHWQIEKPGDKIIIFVEWIATCRHLGRMLKELKISFLYHVGTIPTEARRKTLRDFEEKEDIKVLISSYKTGGKGFNLTCANRIILLTPCWNESLEVQSICRAYRHGQTKDVVAVRIIVKDSIDERMLELQQWKKRELETPNQEGKKEKLCIETWLKLFGAPADASSLAS
ncbi:P-loop containing nucleoside triphosphate hydrolase protein [Xylariomycetidae sp. FL2044]|nr:P-loop containing nucleoside triphosphate hydrolase protein [Xylariomycetidae sp. FL2044]KAH9883318.1 P-loop containing nucleoside triphosphate hydrolase protein [Xylariomycetidae sp. FL2044]KAH9908862.1 P-loop containing nucleoside triphosphate hydrolase protein [Xylariomycetidae sp. FL2044]